MTHVIEYIHICGVANEWEYHWKEINPAFEKTLFIRLSSVHYHRNMKWYIDSYAVAADQPFLLFQG